MHEFKITSNDAGRSILKFLEKIFVDVPKSRLEKAFRNKDIRINNIKIKSKKIILQVDDQVKIYGLESSLKKRHYHFVKSNLKIIYEDQNILVVNKKNGIVMHGDNNSLDEQVLSYLKFIQKSSFIPASIGRLDKVTSGIVIYAKNYPTLRQMKTKSSKFKKIYEFKSDLPKPITTAFKITHSEVDQKEICGKHGKSTKTIFFFNDSRKFAQLITGRKHQIRASLEKLGYPIYGDQKYGGKLADRVYLHSYSIEFAELTGALKYLNKFEIVNQPHWK